MRKTLIVLALLLCAAIDSAAQKILKTEEIHLKVNRILLKRDLGELVNELAVSKDDTVDGLLFALDVFVRAGRNDLVRRTVTRLSTARGLPAEPQRKWVLDVVRPQISHDTAALRLYYELLAVDDGYYSTNPFISEWARTGDPREIDAWIEKHVQGTNSWFWIRLERSLRNGTAAKILDDLAARVRDGQGERQALNTYLASVVHVREQTPKGEVNRFEHEADWIYNAFPTNSAKEAYDLGERVDAASPAAAIRFYLDSLSRKVTDDEIRVMQQAEIRSSYGQGGKIDWEKQLRYWTKQKLAAAYRRTGQALLAQPLIEELMAVKDDDIYTQDNFQLAGAVQSQSGARVVESKVLQDAATAAASPQYWMDRIQYYIGRNEVDGVVNSFREGLANLDRDSKPRFISWFAEWADHAIGSSKEYESYRAELSRILTAEFGNASPDSDLAYRIVVAASSRGLELPDFMDTYFIRRSDLLSTIFKGREDWDNEVKEVLVEILRDSRLTVEKKNAYSAELEKLAASGPVDKRLQLAEIFKDAGEPERRVAQLKFYLAQRPSDRESGSLRSYAVTSLFDAYIIAGDWKAAEKLLTDRQADFLTYFGNYLERLAVSAGQQNAPDDAFRIWLKAVNFNGHSRFGLINLADTTTKPLLRRYYEQMKLKDPTSAAAEQALAILR